MRRFTKIEFFLNPTGITFHPGIPIRPPGTSILPGPGPGIGLSGSYMRLGDAYSKILDNPSIVYGYDKSISGTIGSSTVIDKEIKECCENWVNPMPEKLPPPGALRKTVNLYACFRDFFDPPTKKRTPIQETVVKLEL